MWTVEEERERERESERRYRSQWPLLRMLREGRAITTAAS
jgi:hypothetical protein